MQLRPRHFLLLAAVLAVFVYRIVQSHRAHRGTMTIVTTQNPVIGPRPNTPAWSSFDNAAALRDAPPTQFDPALQALTTQIESTKPAADLEGCKTWLLFYRQSVLHPSPDKTWHNRSAQHLNSCVKNHPDIAS